MSPGSPQERALHPSLLWTRGGAERASELSGHARMQAASDGALLASLRAHNHEALTELFRRHSRFVFGVGYRILQDAGEAEEIVQDVFLYLYQRSSLFDPSKGSAKAWIVQVTQSRSLDRRSFLHRRQFYAGTDVTDFADTLAGESDVERSIISKWNLARLQVALRELPENQRRTLEMFFFEGLELREISVRLGESLENVRHYYYRGLQMLRKSSIVQNLKSNQTR